MENSAQDAREQLDQLAVNQRAVKVEREAPYAPPWYGPVLAISIVCLAMTERGGWPWFAVAIGVLALVVTHNVATLKIAPGLRRASKRQLAINLLLVAAIWAVVEAARALVPGRPDDISIPGVITAWFVASALFTVGIVALNRLRWRWIA